MANDEQISPEEKLLHVIQDGSEREAASSPEERLLAVEQNGSDVAEAPTLVAVDDDDEDATQESFDEPPIQKPKLKVMRDEPAETPPPPAAEAPVLRMPAAAETPALKMPPKAVPPIAEHPKLDVGGLDLGEDAPATIGGYDRPGLIAWN